MKKRYQIVAILILLQACSVKRDTFVQKKGSCQECCIALKDR